MRINFELGDIIESREKEKLKTLFDCENDVQLEETLNNVVKASLSEYKEMFLGRGLPSRADEIQQHRLFYLIKYHFSGRLPSESEVSALFQLTQTRSKSLIRFVMTRFHYDLEEEVKNSLISTLESAEEDSEDGYRVVIQSDNVLEELNRIISREAPDLDPVRKVPKMSRTFAISTDSHNKLWESLIDDEEDGD